MVRQDSSEHTNAVHKGALSDSVAISISRKRAHEPACLRSPAVGQRQDFYLVMSESKGVYKNEAADFRHW